MAKEIVDMRVNRSRVAVGLVLTWCVLVCARAAAADDVKPGTTLDSSTASGAKDLLPPEILSHYQKNEYVNQVLDWPDAKFNWPEDFQAATKKNEGRFAIASDGHIVEKDSNQQPPWVFGFPFPTVDPKEPDAAAQSVWNFFYRTWYFGNLIAESQINMIGPT